MNRKIMNKEITNKELNEKKYLSVYLEGGQTNVWKIFIYL